MSEVHTKEELTGLIDSLVEGLEFYEPLLTPAKLSEIETSKNEQEINIEEELTKLSKLIFAHSTKIGIAFRPPVSINAAYQQLKETSEVFLILIGVLSKLFNIQENDKFGKLYKEEILEVTKLLISSFKELLIELKNLDFNLQKGEVDESYRLINVGKIWENCKKLESLIKEGKIGLLKSKIRLNIAVIEDLIEEFEEWLENPEIVDDPFDFNEESEEEDEKEVDADVIEFANDWIKKVKMVKLLYSSFIKSLPSDKNSEINGTEIDLFFKEQNVFFNLVDELISNIFLNLNILELKSSTKLIFEKSQYLINLLKKMNKNDEKKLNWLSVWQEKFLQ